MCQKDRCNSNELFSRLLMFLYKEGSPEVSKNLSVIAPYSMNKATFFEAGQHIKVLILFFYQFIFLFTFLSNTSVELSAFTGPMDAPHRLASLPAKTEKVKKLYATFILWISWSESVLSSLPFSLYALLAEAVGLILILSEVCKSEQSPVLLSEILEQTPCYGVCHCVPPRIPVGFAAKGNS